MQISFEEFARRADTIREEIRAACAASQRDPATVTLLAVTKTHPALVDGLKRVQRIFG